MGRLVLIDSDILNEVVNALPDVLGTSNFSLRFRLNNFATARDNPLSQIAEELRKHGLTLIRSAKGFRVERLGEVEAQKITGLCTYKKASGGRQLHNLHCGYPKCEGS